MMMESSVPIDHKKDHKCKRKVHNKENDAAGSVFFQFTHHIFAGGMFSCMTYKKKTHDREQDIICRKRKEPESFMPETEPELKNGVCGIINKCSV